MVNYKTLTFILLVFFSLLIGCSNDIENVTDSNKIVCNPPYIQVGTSCCLDQNNNSICDSDEKSESITQVSEEKSSTSDIVNDISTETLIKEHPLKLALYSSEIEAGYSLNRKNSGQYKYYSEDFPELNSATLTGFFVTNYEKIGSRIEEERYLTIYITSFNSIENAKNGFKIIEKKSKENPLYENKEWGLLKVGDERSIFLTNFNINFYPYSKYAGIMRINNIVYEVILTAPASEATGNELWKYLEKIDAKVKNGNFGNSEVDASSISEIGAKKDNLVEIKVNEVTRSYHVSKEEEYSYATISNLANTGKEYLIINLYFKNLNVNNEYDVGGEYKKGVDTSYYNFVVIDEKGNVYTADYSSYAIKNGDQQKIIPQNSGSSIAYLFTVFQDSKEFTLKFYDKNVEIYSLDVN